ncbi:UdgX family uracil-DNA binding protein [Intrasporangium flavum]|uniref:UdgX family uracil-DNA binding protein n=1 Tax=Intrasporangium flavum TaxID=1428657 RepID=UPI0009F9D7F4|nr:UdgX family uracil-DNA binding protein [Intrasporangium flavum]
MSSSGRGAATAPPHRPRPEDFPGAAQWVPPRASVAELRAAVNDCRGCDLFLASCQAVMGEGPPDAHVMVVGEQPGDQEDLAGRPFVGPAGRLLDWALADAGFDPGAVFRTNVVKHFRHTQRGKRRIHEGPSRWHVAACEPWLLAELGAVRPSVVVLLGATAGQAVFGTSFRVGAMRGRRLEWPAEHPSAWAPTAVVATAHPSSVLRSRRRDEDLSVLVADLVMARQLLDDLSED